MVTPNRLVSERGGWWGSQPLSDYAENWGVFAQIKNLLTLSLKDASRGVQSELWLPAPFTGVTPIACSCVRQNTASILCESCYGLGVLGGYRKYGYNYLDISSIDSSLIYDTNEIVLDQSMRPFRLRLNAGVDSAEIITTALPLALSLGTEYKLNSYLLDSYNGVLLAFSLDGGTTWLDISELDSLSDPDAELTFRIILTRNTDERSPYFEFLRVRSRDMSIAEPFIFVSRTRNPEDVEKQKQGLLTSEPGVKYWTMLDFVLPPRCFINNNEPANPFYQEKFELFNFNRSFFDPHRLRQLFEARVISRDREIYYKIF